MTTKRNINIELLRIISMFMIVILHFLYHGNVLNYTSTNNPRFILFLLESICIIAVNVYVLISGYFLVDKKFDIHRIVKLILQVWFYSVIINFFLIIIGEESLTVSNLIKTFFPILTQQYWFINAYLILLFMSPFLNILIDKLDKKKHQFLIAILLISNTILPFFTRSSVSIQSANSITWFVNLYIVAAYLKRYDLNIKQSITIIIYIITITINSLLAFIINHQFGFSTAMYIYKYNSPLVFLSSLLIFIIFMKQKQNIVKNNRLVTFFSSSTLAVYLIHENSFMRLLLWNKIIPTTKYVTSWFYIIYILALSSAIFIVCIIIDKLVKPLTNKLSLDSKIMKYLNFNIFTS